jgi:hypothetical protein
VWTWYWGGCRGRRRVFACQCPGFHHATAPCLYVRFAGPSHMNELIARLRHFNRAFPHCSGWGRTTNRGSSSTPEDANTRTAQWHPSHVPRISMPPSLGSVSPRFIAATTSVKNACGTETIQRNPGQDRRRDVDREVGARHSSTCVCLGTCPCRRVCMVPLLHKYVHRCR